MNGGKRLRPLLLLLVSIIIRREKKVAIDLVGGKEDTSRCRRLQDGPAGGSSRKKGNRLDQRSHAFALWLWFLLLM